MSGEPRRGWRAAAAPSSRPVLNRGLVGRIICRDSSDSAEFRAQNVNSSCRASGILAGGRPRLGYFGAMNPARKRTVRLVVALCVAVTLAGALMYTSFSAASPTLDPSQLATQAVAGRSYQVTGRVVAHSVRRDGAVLEFSVADRSGGAAVPIRYSGEVPDPFREGREVIVTVRKSGASYVGERNSLITKCPSKYKTAPPKEKRIY